MLAKGDIIQIKDFGWYKDHRNLAGEVAGPTCRDYDFNYNMSQYCGRTARVIDRKVVKYSETIGVFPAPGLEDTTVEAKHDIVIVGYILNIGPPWITWQEWMFEPGKITKKKDIKQQPIKSIKMNKSDNFAGCTINDCNPLLFQRLVNIDKFCQAKGINYAVSGTLALKLLGIPVEAHDIDLKAQGLTAEQKVALRELQSLAEIDIHEEYDNECFMFNVGNSLVNVLPCPETEIIDFVPVTILDDTNKYYVIKVQNLWGALKDKMKLGRPKDKAFMLNLIKKLSNI